MELVCVSPYGQSCHADGKILVASGRARAAAPGLLGTWHGTLGPGAHREVSMKLTERGRRLVGGQDTVRALLEITAAGALGGHSRWRHPVRLVAPNVPVALPRAGRLLRSEPGGRLNRARVALRCRPAAGGSCTGKLTLAFRRHPLRRDQASTIPIAHESYELAAGRGKVTLRITRKLRQISANRRIRLRVRAGAQDPTYFRYVRAKRTLRLAS